jgi:hypothetical protein
LPTPTSSGKTNKFDLSIAYYGPSNLKYENFFPEIFLIDGTDTTNTITSVSYSFSNPSSTSFGSPTTGQIGFTWPFDSSLSGYESKISINVNGGYSATWNSIDTITISESTSYQILWVNKKLNKFICAIPNKAVGATTLKINSLTNPYPYQK